MYMFTLPRGPCYIEWGMSWINWDVWSMLAKTQIAFQPTDHSLWDAYCVVFPKPVDTQMITSARLSCGHLSCFLHWARKSLKMKARFFIHGCIKCSCSSEVAEDTGSIPGSGRSLYSFYWRHSYPGSDYSFWWISLSVKREWSYLPWEKVVRINELIGVRWQMVSAH